MHHIVIRQARPGMCLTRTVTNPRPPQSKLLAAGITLTPEQIAHLHEMAVYDLWVSYPGLTFLEDLAPADCTSHQRRICEALRDALHCHAPHNLLLIDRARPLIEELVRCLLDNPALQPILSALATADDSLLTHSADVCALGLLLGMRLQDYIIEQRRRLTTRQARDLVNLGLGCLLHEIGELQLPENQRESRRAAAHHSQAGTAAGGGGEGIGDEWKLHTELGYLALRHIVEPSAANIVLHHHQHFDGSGFALNEQREVKLTGSAIHVFSRIAAAADIFQHVLHSFSGAMPHPQIHALAQIQQPAFRAWCDPVILQALLEIVPPFVPGMVITLSDHRQGIITRISRETPCYPHVQILRNLDALNPESVAAPAEVIDLTKSPSLNITAIDGSRVDPCLYGPRSVPQESPRRLSA